MENKQLKTIDLKEKSFTANGKVYYIETGISFDRYLMYQKLQIEVGYAIGFSGLYDKMKEVYSLCNDRKFADIAVLANNVINGIKQISSRKIPALSLCALFINTADEDRGVITDDMVDAKISDWEAEGLDITPFFSLAIACVASA